MTDELRPTYAMTGRQVLALALTSLTVLLAASALSGLILFLIGKPTRELPPELYLTLLLLLPFASLFLWIYGFTIRKAPMADRWLGLAKMDAKLAAAGIGAGFASAAISWSIIMLTRPWLGEPSNLFIKLDGMIGGLTPSSIVILLLFGSVLAPLAEEIMFRGALYTWFRTRFRVMAAALFVAVLHTILHIDPAVMPALLVVFFWYGLIFEWAGNLWVPILAHATNNALAFFWVYWQIT